MATALARPAPASPPLPPDESWSDGRLELPGGILDTDGRRHRVLHVRELTGRDEEILGDRRYTSGAQQVTDFLQQVIVGVDGLDTPVDVGGMLVGDRDYIVLRLRQIAVGDGVHQVVRCPNVACGQKADVDFLISELPVRRVENLPPSFEVSLSRPAVASDAESVRCILRLPTGADHEAVSAAAPANDGSANTVLLSRVVKRIGRNDRVHEGVIRDLPLAVRRELLDFLARTAPGPELSVTVQCPSCGGDLSYPFDIYDFFFSEWRMSLAALYEQVHVLALGYHWGEREILAMTRTKRERYVANLARHIDRAGA